MELSKPSGLVSLSVRMSVCMSVPPPVPAEWSTLIGPTVGVDTNSWANESAPLWTRVGVDTGVDTSWTNESAPLWCRHRCRHQSQIMVKSPDFCESRSDHRALET